MPTLVIWGQGRILDDSNIEAYDQHLPGASIVIMKNCGHTPMAERSEEAAALYLTFLGVPTLSVRPRGLIERRE